MISTYYLSSTINFFKDIGEDSSDSNIDLNSHSLSVPHKINLGADLHMVELRVQCRADGTKRT